MRMVVPPPRCPDVASGRPTRRLYDSIWTVAQATIHPRAAFPVGFSLLQSFYLPCGSGSRSSPCSIVLEMLEPMDAERKAYHLIGGVLAERKVGDVKPILQSNREAVSSAAARQRAAVLRAEPRATRKSLSLHQSCLLFVATALCRSGN